MTTTTHEAATHAVVSHGADFFGQDRHPVKSLISLAPYASSSFSWADREKVAPLVQALEQPTDQKFPADQAAVLAEQLLKVSRCRHLKPKPSALARALADAAARAAADGEPWVWRIEAGADA
jgi:hypothetical protein